MNKIFVWDNTAGSEALIKKIESSPYINNIFYTNKKILYPSKKAILLETDGIKLIKEILYRGY